MPALPARPDLDQLRRRARELLASARAGDDAAMAMLRAVSDRITLTSAQLALARHYGFGSWARLKTEVERRRVLDRCDVDQLQRMLTEDPSLAVAEMLHWHDHPLGAAPLNYVAMLRYDTSAKVWRDVPGTAAMARALLAAGAPVNGDPGAFETPLITAASYGDAEVATVLVEAGADVEAVSAVDSGGVPGGTALVHAAVFGMTAVLDVLVAAGAAYGDLVMSAAAGDLSGRDVTAASQEERIRALVMAADHQRLDVIDALVAAGVPVDAVDNTWGRHPLRLAAENGRPASVRRLLALGADPTLTDARGRAPLQLARAGHATHPDEAGYAEVFALLA